MPPNGVNARSVSCNKTFCPPNIRVLSDSIRPVYAACDVSTSEFRFKVVFKFVPDDGGRAFLTRARETVAAAGFTLQHEVYTGARFN